MAMADIFDAEVDANFDAFRLELPKLVPQYSGQFALLRHQRIEGFFEDARAALAAGVSRFGDSIFSIQEVTEQPVDLGFFSHAVDLRIA